MPISRSPASHSKILSNHDSDDVDDASDTPSTPLAYSALLALGLGMFSNALLITVLFPFAPLMVQDWNCGGLNPDKTLNIDWTPSVECAESVGFEVGWIGSAFMIGRFLSAYFWGRLADTHGRRPVILAGLASIILFSPLFRPLSKPHLGSPHSPRRWPFQRHCRHFQSLRL
eukprot:GABV01001204.1.p1 GENE.GABV01001204.1~~GABV01001204.1.p1  ORF type:complete len:194 (-),score=42.07 GABV01001204.1:372-887(-)